MFIIKNIKNKSQVNKIGGLKDLDKRTQYLSLSEEEIRGLQLKSLEIAKYFKSFCEENNLLFYLCGGGCIGALRHKGFIPWDDDIDVFMPRKDYEKLYVLWNEKADKKRFSCLKTTDTVFMGNIFTTIVNNNTTVIRPHQRNLDIPQGVCMDIFPLDGCPSGKIRRKIQKFWALIYSLYMAQIVPENHGKLIYLIGKTLLGLIPNKNMRYKFAKYAQKQMSKYPIESCEKITELCAGPHYMQNEYPKEVFKSAIYKEFEGEMMPIPIGYDKYLKIAFGDYMTLPPKEQRIPHHDILFMDLDKSYKEYKGIKYLTEGKI